MKNCLLVLARCLLLTAVILGGTHLSVLAQVYATASPLPMQRSATEAHSFQSENKRSVRSILFALEESYHVSFSYNDAVVHDLTLKENFSWNKNEALEAVLKRLVDQADLKFEKMSSDSYLILTEKKEGGEKKVIEKEHSKTSESLVPQIMDLPGTQPTAQETKDAAHQVAGVVKDDTNSPLPGVNVVVKGTTNGTTTDSDGKYVLSVEDASSVLVFSFIGYASQEVAINNQTMIDITMSADLKTLNEVIVVGYGEVKRANVLGAVADIKPEEVQDLSVANLGTALMNRVPGVGVSQASGKPGSTTTISIRNPQTFVASTTIEPLFIIDGFQVTKLDFDNLDATQVESITFLKDAAASIYGSRGANGVVLVKTKRGKPGKAKISYQGTYGISAATKFPDMLNSHDHALLLNGLNLANAQDPANLYTEAELEYLKTHNYSWLDETWQNSHLQRHTLNVSGGSEDITYFAGASYYDETGNLGDLYAKKYSIRFGMKANITKNLTADVSLSTDNSTLNRPSPKGVTVQSETLSETISSLILMPAWIPMNIDGKPVYTSTGWHPRELQNSGSYSKSNSQGVILNASLEYKVPTIKGLSFRVQYARNSRNAFGKEYYASYKLNEFKRQGIHGSKPTGANQNVIFTDTVTQVRTIANGNQLYESHNSNAFYQLNEAITYARRFGNHDFNLLLLAEQSETSGDVFTVKREQQVISGIDQIFGFSGTQTNWDNTGSGTETGRMSYLGRLNYGFMDRYLLEATFRADASPNFPTNSQWGYFPSVAVGWKISEENFFMNNIRFVNDLKFRFQVGLTGNDQVPAYQYKERYTQTTGMLWGSVLTSGLNNNVSPNPNITWEKALYKNFGIDGTFLDRKFNFSVDVYHRYNYDMLNTPETAVPTTYGGTISDQNYGRLKSWGTEFMLGYNGVVRDFSYSVSMNFAITDNRVVRRFVSAGDAGTWRDPNGRRTDSGIEGYRSLGMIKTQEELDAFVAANPDYKINGKPVMLGWMLFEDINGDNNITDLDRVRLKERSGPRFGAGFNLGASWKGFKLSANIALALGGYEAYDKPARTAPTVNQSALAHWKDAWSPVNPTGNYPAIDAPFNNDIYDMWIVKATTMRVNNMTLSYVLPSSLITKYNLPQVRVVLTGTNLWDIINNTPYKYSMSNQAIDYPSMRTYTFGLNVSL